MAHKGNQFVPLYCVKCGKPNLRQQSEKAFGCSSCGFVYFHNVAAAVAALIVCNHHVLLVERAQSPNQGKLDFPGGFVDGNESNEQALRRELQEELQLSIQSPKYLFSFPNRYRYEKIDYCTVDSYFAVILPSKPKIVLQKEEVSQFHWINWNDIDPAALAFDSGRKAVARYWPKKEA